MTQFESRTKETGAEVFFIRYRKLITVLCVLLLLFLPFKMYDAPTFSIAHKYEFIGYWADTCIFSLALPIVMLIYTRKVNKAYRREHNNIEQHKSAEVKL